MIFFDQKSSAGLAVTHHQISPPNIWPSSHVSSLPTIIFVVIWKFSFLGQEFLPSQAVAVGTEGFPIFAPPIEPPMIQLAGSFRKKMSGLMKILRNSPTYTSTCESFLNFLAFFLKVSLQIRKLKPSSRTHDPAPAETVTPRPRKWNPTSAI